MKKSLFSFYLPNIALAAILAFPLYWMFMTSVLPDGMVYHNPPSFLPGRMDPSAYSRVLFERPMVTWLTNSAVITIITTLVSMSFATLAGYSLSRFRVPGGEFAATALLISRMLPSTLLVIPMYVIFIRLKLLNSWLSLVIANTSFIVPFATWMMKGFFDAIPREIEQAAMVDGCSRTGAFFRVTLPLAVPGLLATGVYSAILTWDEYLFAKTLITNANLRTVTVGLATFSGEYTVQWNDLMAASLISVVPILLAFAWLEKYLVRGMTSGAVK